MSVEYSPDSFKHPEIGDTQPTSTRLGKLRLNARLIASTLTFRPEVPDELPKEVHFDEDGTIIRHDESPELVGTNGDRQTTVVLPEQDTIPQSTTETKQ